MKATPLVQYLGENILDQDKLDSVLELYNRPVKVETLEHVLLFKEFTNKGNAVRCNDSSGNELYATTSDKKIEIYSLAINGMVCNSDNATIDYLLHLLHNYGFEVHWNENIVLDYFTEEKN